MKNLILTSLLLLCSLIGYSAQKQVAVYVSGNQEEEIKKVLGQKVVTYITQSQDYQAIERTRDFLNSLKSEQDYQASGEVSLGQIVDLGNQFGAQYVAAVDVSKIFGELFVAARLIDVSSGTVEVSYESTGTVNNMQALTQLANDIADGLILAPKRKVQEARNAELRREQQAREAEQQRILAEQRREQEKEELKRLRETAIKNLTPSGCKISGGLMFMTSLIPVDMTPSGAYVNLSVNIPYGFHMARLNEISELYNNGHWWNALIIFNRDLREERTSGGHRDWHINAFYQGGIRNLVAASTVWKNHLVFEFQESLYAIAIKDAPSESQIQAEINRLKYSR